MKLHRTPFIPFIDMLAVVKVFGDLDALGNLPDPLEQRPVDSKRFIRPDSGRKPGFYLSRPGIFNEDNQGRSQRISG